MWFGADYHDRPAHFDFSKSFATTKSFCLRDLLLMGLMRFLVPRTERLAPDAIERAYVSGMDDLPWQTKSQWSDGQLLVRRAEADSGTFHIPWRTNGQSERMLATATLMDRDVPYILPVEIARGTVHRLRNQSATWQSLGLSVDSQVSSLLREALEQLSLATTQRADLVAADEHAQQAIERALAAGRRLSVLYAEQSLAIQKRNEVKTTSLFGVNLGSAPLDEGVLKQITSTFDTAILPLCWREVEQHEGTRDWKVYDRQLEWCRAHGLKICGGPLVQLDRSAIPDWLYLWEGDYENLLSFTADYIRAAVTRYRGRIQLWQCAARLNVADVFSLSEEQRLRLAVLAIEATQQADPRSPVVLTIDQPCAEFMSESECDLSPLYFADALVLRGPWSGRDSAGNEYRLLAWRYGIA